MSAPEEGAKADTRSHEAEFQFSPARCRCGGLLRTQLMGAVVCSACGQAPTTPPPASATNELEALIDDLVKEARNPLGRTSAARAALLAGIKRHTDEAVAEIVGERRLCDCCYSLAESTADDDGKGNPLGHIQCEQCSRIAALESQLAESRAELANCKAFSTEAVGDLLAIKLQRDEARLALTAATERARKDRYK